MQEHHTNDSESLSLPIPDEALMRTPSVTDSTGGAISEKQARERGRMVKVADQVAQLAFENGLKVSDAITVSLLPTPTLGHIRNYDEPVDDYLQRRQDYVDGKTKGMPGVSLGVAIRMQLFPTPKALDGIKGNLKTSEERKAAGHYVDLTNVAIDLAPPLLPTPNTMEHREIKTPEQIAALKEKSPGGYRNLRETVINEAVSWGKFEPAIARWEQITGRPAPAPTKPDGKNEAHRLSSKFTEWMMGLPDGWVTDCGLTRNEELKACGNGVVPQQAELALLKLFKEINNEN